MSFENLLHKIKMKFSILHFKVLKMILVAYGRNIILKVIKTKDLFIRILEESGRNNLLICVSSSQNISRIFS